MKRWKKYIKGNCLYREEGKDQEAKSIQSSTTPDLGYRMGK